MVAVPVPAIFVFLICHFFVRHNVDVKFNTSNVAATGMFPEKEIAMITFAFNGPFACEFACLRTTRQKFSGPRATFPFVVLTNQKILIEIDNGWQEYELRDAIEEADVSPEIFFWGLFYMPDEDVAQWGVARWSWRRIMPEVKMIDVERVTEAIKSFLVGKKIGPVVGSD